MKELNNKKIALNANEDYAPESKANLGPLFYMLGEKTAVMDFTSEVSLATQQKIWGVAQSLSGHADILEIVPGMNNLSVILRSPQKSEEPVLSLLAELWEKSEAFLPIVRTIEIPVIYGGEFGPDLEEVAQHAGMTQKQVVECHSAIDYTVFFLGFKPGFPYLGGLPDNLATPRRQSPRIAVPAGSVGIGGNQTGIYPTQAPGGWQLIGRTMVPLFNPANSSPTLLQPGDTLRFVPSLEGTC